MDFSYTIKMLVTLALLCGLLYAILKWAESLKLKRFSGEMRVLDRLPVGPNQSLLIVKIRDKDYLMSVGKDVQLLKEIDAKTLA